VNVSDLLRKLVECHGDLPRSLLHVYLEQWGVVLNIEDTLLDDRGFCHSGTLGQDAQGFAYFLLTIPEKGEEVPEKRHLRLFPGPLGRERPVITLGEEHVRVLAGELEIFGADVAAPTVLSMGMEAISYGCEVREGQVALFQDSHGLRALAPWTTMIFRRRDVTPEEYGRCFSDPAAWQALKTELEEAYGRNFPA